MIEDVQLWIENAGQTTKTDNPEQRNLYAKLITEEYGEFVNAYVDGDDTEQLDAVCDLIWVTIGYALSRGWDIKGAFEEVVNSNFSKFDPETGLPIKNPETGKIMKSQSFSAPNLTPFLSKTV
jgi:NTP pyrophosphatase (non-canonical NTP hydrolase)